MRYVLVDAGGTFVRAFNVGATLIECLYWVENNRKLLTFDGPQVFTVTDPDALFQLPAR